MENNNNSGYKSKEVGFKSLTQKNAEAYRPEKNTSLLEKQRKGAKLDTLSSGIYKQDASAYDACKDE